MINRIRRLQGASFGSRGFRRDFKLVRDILFGSLSVEEWFEGNELLYGHASCSQPQYLFFFTFFPANFFLGRHTNSCQLFDSTNMKVLSVINRTEEELALCFKLHARKVQSATELKSAVISPAALCTIEVSKFPSCLTLAATLREDNPEAQEKGNESQLNRFSSRISLSLTTTWHAVKVEEGSPWRIYRRRVSIQLFDS